MVSWLVVIYETVPRGPRKSRLYITKTFDCRATCARTVELKPIATRWLVRALAGTSEFEIAQNRGDGMRGLYSPPLAMVKT